MVQGAGDQSRQEGLGSGNLEGSAKTLGEGRKASRGRPFLLIPLGGSADDRVAGFQRKDANPLPALISNDQGTLFQLIAVAAQ